MFLLFGDWWKKNVKWYALWINYIIAPWVCCLWWLSICNEEGLAPMWYYRYVILDKIPNHEFDCMIIFPLKIDFLKIRLIKLGLVFSIKSVIDVHILGKF